MTTPCGSDAQPTLKDPEAALRKPRRPSPLDRELLEAEDEVAGPFGALRRHVDQGLLTEENLHAELGEIVAGHKPGRENDDETILFWHRGLSLSDIALGSAMLDKAAKMGLGQQLLYSDGH